MTDKAACLTTYQPVAAEKVSDGGQHEGQDLGLHRQARVEHHQRQGQHRRHDRPELPHGDRHRRHAVTQGGMLKGGRGDDRGAYVGYEVEDEGDEAEEPGKRHMQQREDDEDQQADHQADEGLDTDVAPDARVADTSEQEWNENGAFALEAYAAGRWLFTVWLPDGPDVHVDLAPYAWGHGLGRRREQVEQEDRHQQAAIQRAEDT